MLTNKFFNKNRKQCRDVIISHYNISGRTGVYTCEHILTIDI
jgi:hypothetical protein